MDSFWILLLIVLVSAVVVVPVISLVKLFAVSSRLERIEEDLQQLKRSSASGKESPSVAAEEMPVEKVEKPLPDPVRVETPELPSEEPLEEVHDETGVVPEVGAYVAVEADDAEQSVYVAPVVPVAEVEAPKVEDVPLPPPVSPIKKEPRKEKPPYRFENLLSKVGIVTLVLGIAFFVKYAIDKDWINEVGRVAIGVLVGGLLVGIAHKLREKYALFSALMVGGGISVLYITVTLAFREYHLFGQAVAFAILIGITIFSVILSLVYDRKELALFSLLGGYASPLMISTGEGNYVVLFSFLFILNSGMLVISTFKKWGVIGIVSFVCTQLFYWAWLLGKFETQYTGALIFAGLFFVQFYLLALFDHFLSGRKISPFQVGVILANNLSLFAATIYIFNETELRIQGLITLSMALINAVVMLVLFRKATVDKRLIYLIIAVVLSFVSLAVPVQLNGHVITMFWAAEIVILLWLWQKSGIKVFRAGFLLIAVLTLVSYFMDAFHIYSGMYSPLPVVFNRIFITGLVVIAAFVLSHLMLQKEKGDDGGIVSVAVLKRLSAIVVWVMGYLVPFLEIRYQFGHSGVEGIYSFTAMMLAIYTTLYVAVLSGVFRKRIQENGWLLASLFFFVFLYLAFALPAMIDLRNDVFYTERHKPLFLTHYLTLPALACIFYVIAKSIRRLSKQVYAFCGWLLVACSVVVLSVELDHAVVQIGATPVNYDGLLYDVHTFGYPILWGVLAMILMVWGLKAKEVLLRQISLGFFAFIVLKFYISDIWLMSQTGRIISFVVLGVILLLVSFLIQKIKVLIKDSDEPADTEI